MFIVAELTEGLHCCEITKLKSLKFLEFNNITPKNLQNWRKTFLENAEIAMEPAKAVKEYKDEIEELQEFIDAGLATITPDKIEVNKTGAMLIRNIVLPFDEYFKKMKNQKVFSKSI